MSNLKPLVWFELESTNRLICEVVTPICEYSVWKDSNSMAYSVLYYNRHTEAPTKEATGFATIDEAKQWVWNHYNEKMQPYVKPSSTWIDASDQLPVSDRSYLCAIVDKGFINYRITMFWTVVDKFAFNHEKVLAWMPLPEPPTCKQGE